MADRDQILIYLDSLTWGLFQVQDSDYHSIKEGRDGSDGLAQVIDMHSPIKLVILMLGTNDFQCTH